MYEPPKTEIFLTKFFIHTPFKEIYRSFASSIILKGDEEVLDFGSGYGTVAKYVAPRLTDGNLTCVDISKIWQYECRGYLRNFKNIYYFNDHIYRLDALEKFDIIYVHFVFHDICHIELEKIISHIIKILKTGGTLYIREPMSNKKVFELLNKSNLQIVKSKKIFIPLMGTSYEIQYKKTLGK